jgi:ribosome-associated protein
MKKKPTLPTTPTIPTEEKSRLIARLLDEKQGEDILLLDVSGVCPITERLILVTGRGQRHAQALADAAMALCNEKKLVSFGMEGYEGGAWILLDLNDVIVHVFQEDSRRFYNLEGLWHEGRRVDWAEAVMPEGEGE